MPSLADVMLEMCDILHLPARLAPRRRETSPQPPSFGQRNRCRAGA
jgi:hypothetical protein